MARRIVITDHALERFAERHPEFEVLTPGGTGRAVRISGYEEWTFDSDGRIARSLGYFDEAAYRAQLQGLAESR